MSSKTLMVTSLATTALAWPAAAPARSADPTPAPPPPSSMAVSAADEYARLRAPSGGAVDLRSPDTRDHAAGQARTVQETVRDNASGFDALSGALGLAAGVGLAIAAAALAGGPAGRRLPRRDAARG